MATHEILTLQLGGYANFVGAHFWNFQARIASHRLPCAVRGVGRAADGEGRRRASRMSCWGWRRGRTRRRRVRRSSTPTCCFGRARRRRFALPSPDSARAVLSEERVVERGQCTAVARAAHSSWCVWWRRRATPRTGCTARRRLSEPLTVCVNNRRIAASIHHGMSSCLPRRRGWKVSSVNSVEATAHVHTAVTCPAPHEASVAATRRCMR